MTTFKNLPVKDRPLQALLQSLANDSNIMVQEIETDTHMYYRWHKYGAEYCQQFKLPFGDAGSKTFLKYLTISGRIEQAADDRKRQRGD